MSSMDGGDEFEGDQLDDVAQRVTNLEEKFRAFVKLAGEIKGDQVFFKKLGRLGDAYESYIGTNGLGTLDEELERRTVSIGSQGSFASGYAGAGGSGGAGGAGGAGVEGVSYTPAGQYIGDNIKGLIQVELQNMWGGMNTQVWESLKPRVEDLMFELVKQSATDLLGLFALPGIAKRVSSTEGHFNLSSVQYELRKLSEQAAMLMKTSFTGAGRFDQCMNLYAVSREAEAVERLAGVVTGDMIVEEAEKLRQEMKPIFAMIEDPQLALSARVKAFDLT